MQKEILIATVECSALIALTLFLSSCLAFVSPQIINSYPLAIDFEHYARIPTGPSLPVQSPWPQTAKRISLVAHQDNIPPYKVINTVSHQKRSQVVTPVAHQSAIQSGYWASTTTVDGRAGLHPPIYQKRTLPAEIPSRVDKKSNEDGTNLEITRNNSSDTQETRKLLLLRQKMIDMQGRINVSIEDTNWKIAAGCLSSQSGNQFIRNKDVKCAASQVVLSISRMQRAGCKQCESYFHCEGFSNALKRCKDNYDVQDTLSVMRSCQGLTSDDFESVEATRAPSQGVDCQKSYLCGRSCNYNPADGTCPRNNCDSVRVDDNISQYKYYLRSRRGRPTSVAYPAGSPIKSRIVERRN